MHTVVLLTFEQMVEKSWFSPNSLKHAHILTNKNWLLMSPNACLFFLFFRGLQRSSVTFVENSTQIYGFTVTFVLPFLSHSTFLLLCLWSSCQSVLPGVVEGMCVSHVVGLQWIVALVHSPGASAAFTIRRLGVIFTAAVH